jgi:uncharacterized repeat protein (TIGR03987 family)
VPVSATVIITLALVFYTVGVWGERIGGRLRLWNLILFIAGLVCDTVGTGMMFDYAGKMLFNLHGITGMLAIVLMFLHALWAAVVLIRKDEKWITRFHRLSIFVWIVWLVPYVSQIFIGILEKAK